MANPNHNALAYDWTVTQYVAYDGATASAVLPVGLHILSPSTDCWVKGGAAAPVASIANGSIFVPKGAMFHFYNVDATHKISIIKDATAGAMSILKAV